MRTGAGIAAVAVVRCAWSMRLVGYARRCGHDVDAAHRRLRVGAAYALAGRQAAEVLVAVPRRSRAAPRWPAVLDGLHALSMVPVAILSRSLRRDAVTSGLVSALLAIVSR